MMYVTIFYFRTGVLLMKKTRRILAAVLCICMLFCGLSLQGFAAGRTNTDTMFRLYGDIDGNGKVEQSDYEKILAFATGAEAKPAVGTPEYYAADIMGDGITMEDARRCYRYVNGLDTADTYSPKDRDVQLFNDLVNVIKSDNFKANEFMAYYSYTYDHMEINNFEFGSLTGMLKDLWTEEEGDTETYSPFYKNRFVYTTETATEGRFNTNFPGVGRDVVSTLSADDVKNIKIEVGVPCTFSQDCAVPDSFVRGNTTYDLTAYKTKEATYTDCIKITVEIKDETYSKDVATLPEGKNSALYNFYGIDKKEEASYYPFETREGDDSLGFFMRIDLDDMRTSATAVYYFDCATLNPMAAGYYIEEDSTQKAALEVDVLGSPMKGSMEPRELLITRYNYWFGSFFG